ncbi:MAG: type IX secretion system plug protein domain-containing protein, partial [Bacteroidota bacterium]
MHKFAVFLVIFPICYWLQAQRLPDQVYMPAIKTVKLFQQNNQQSLPVLTLNSTDQLELHFDDMIGYARNYYYTYILCNADWTPADVNVFDYIRGFTQNRLS